MSAVDIAADALAADEALIERKKMLAGEAYDAMKDPGLLEGRLRARKLMHKYNTYPPPDYVKGMDPGAFYGPDERFQILADLLDVPLASAKKLSIEPPFSVDYGNNIEFKGECYMNYNCIFLDCAKITIGDRCMFAPNVQIYAATHSVEVAERVAGLERAYPVTIGDDCWMGGNSVIIGPSTIGNGCTVAAGSVVRGVFPDNVVIGGTPARILKHLDAAPLPK